MTSASAKDLAALVSAALRDIVTGEPLVGDARVDMTASDLRPVAALLTRYAEVEGELETTEEERAAVPTWRTINGDSPFMGRILRDLTRLTTQVAALKEERKAVEAVATYWQHKAIDTVAELAEANARAERLAGALPDLDPVITWLADGCHVPSAVLSLRLLKRRIDALLTEPEAGDHGEDR